MVTQKTLHQRANIVTALTQGRQLNGKNAQAVKQIFPKTTLGYLFVELTVGSGNNAHIEIDQTRAAKTLYLSLLQHTKQFCLQFNRHFRNFIKEQSTAVGLFKFPSSALMCTGKSTLLITKQNGLEHALGHSRAIERNKRPVTAFRTFVDGPGQYFFSGSRFSTDQNCSIGKGNP